MSSSIAAPQLADPNKDGSPWRFLEPLEEDQAADCELLGLTRADDLEIIGDMVATSRVSLLYAFSGNGKSSLIHAGLIPRFRSRRGYIVFKTRPRPPWSIHDPTCAFKDCVLQGMEPSPFLQSEMQKLRELQNLASALDGTLSMEVESVLASYAARLQRFSPDLVSSLRAKMDLPLAQFVTEIQEHLGPETRFLFVCDQFEELFVHYQNTPEADRFVQELGEVWADDALKVHFLFSMREDWVGSMIAFRRAIPEIFASYYRLAPLSCRSAATVLKRPLEQRGLAWEEGVVSELLFDLARAYSANQADRFNGINLTPSPADDPYVELPALQIVADELWRTRETSPRPFSLEHYCSLVDSRIKAGWTSDREISPAQYVLDGYLKRRLDSIPEAAEKREAMEDLRVECLYALTDRSRHRRALVEKALVEEVHRLRPSTLGLGEIQKEDIKTAVKPLVENHLITEHDAPGGQTEFELAHDFAVRSVVQLWRDLDRKRTALLALLRQERERRDAQLAVAADQERRVLKLLKVAPFGAVIGVLALIATLLLRDRLEVGQLGVAVLSETFVLTTIISAFAGIALMSRRGLASVTLLAAMAGINIAIFPILPDVGKEESVWFGSVRLPAVIHIPSSLPRHERDFIGIEVVRSTNLHFSVDNELSRFDGGVIYAKGGVSKLRLINDLDLSGNVPGDISVDPGFYWLWIDRSSDTKIFQVTSDDVSPTVPRIVALDHLGEAAGPYDATVFCLEVCAGCLVIAALWNFVVLNRLSGGSSLATRIGRVLLAESLDAVLVLAVVALALSGVSTLAKSYSVSSPPLRQLAFVFIVSIALLKAKFLVWKRTPGLVLGGLGIASGADDATKPSLRSLVVRELLFAVWSVCNLGLGIPTLLVTPFIVRSSRNRQNFYDTWARTRLVDIEVLRSSETKERPETATVA